MNLALKMLLAYELGKLGWFSGREEIRLVYRRDKYIIISHDPSLIFLHDSLL